VIGPIMTEAGGAAWRQTIFHPFAQAAQHARGNVLRTHVESASYSTKSHPDVPFVLASVLHDAASGTVTVLALNRNAHDAIELEVELRRLGASELAFASELHHGDLKAINSRQAQAVVQPQTRDDVALRGECLRVKLKPLSWNVFVVKTAGD
jgi:alpha-N-arabinofuranosidase